MKLSIIILNFNTKKLCRDCLKSIYKNEPNFSYEIILADNCSTDGSCKVVKSEFPKVKVISNKINLGFAKGNNLASKRARGEYLLFLNSDTLVGKDSIAKMTEFLNEKPKAGIVGPKLLTKNRRVQPYAVGYYLDLARSFKIQIANWLNRNFKKSTWVKNLSTGLNLEYWNWKKPKQVDWVSGAALMIRKKVFNQIRGFDSRFFMYFEDQDLCLRAHRKGWKIYALPSAKVVHLGGQSFTLSQERRKAYRKSQRYFLGKNFGKFQQKLFDFLYQFLKERDEQHNEKIS